MKENKTVSWLKRIFSATTITIILSLATLILAYFTYADSKSGDLSIKVNGNIIPISSKSDYSDIPICIENCVINNLKPNDSIIYLDNYAKLPILINESNKSIRNVHLEVFIKLTGDTIFYDIKDEFEPHNYGFKFKAENIEAFLAIKNPIKTVYLPKKIREYGGWFMISYNYQMSFEGIDQPVQLPYHLSVDIDIDDYSEVKVDGEILTFGTKVEDKYLNHWRNFLYSLSNIKTLNSRIDSVDSNGKLSIYNPLDRPYVLTFCDTTVIINNLKDYKDRNKEFTSIEEFQKYVKSQQSGYPYMKQIVLCVLLCLLVLSVIFLFYKRQKNKKKHN